MKRCRFGRFWLTVMGSGYSPIMPGTAGALVVLLVYTVAVVLGWRPEAVGLVMVGVMAHGIVVTLVWGDRVIAELNSETELVIEDPSIIVSDEQAGQAMTLASVLWLSGAVGAGRQGQLIFGLAGFVLFRVFDIIKPPPVRQMEKLPGAVGVLVDDLGAAGYAMVVLTVLWQFEWVRGLGA